MLEFLIAWLRTFRSEISNKCLKGERLLMNIKHYVSSSILVNGKNCAQERQLLAFGTKVYILILFHTLKIVFRNILMDTCAGAVGCSNLKW